MNEAKQLTFKQTNTANDQYNIAKNSMRVGVVGVVFVVEMSRLYVCHQFSFSAFSSYMILRLKTSSL